jgi:hypothetical protein
MAGFLSAAIAAIGSSSIGSALVRIVIAYGISRLINKSTGADNQQQVDQGIRLQLQPNTTNPIPLLYGSAYYGGNITDAQLTNNNQTMWVCLTLSEHTTTARLSDGAAVSTFVDEVYYNNQRVTFKADGITVDYVTNSDGTVDTSPRDLVKIYLYKNGSSQPVLPTGYSGTLPPAAHTLFPGWDSNWTMTNLTFALVRLDYNRDKGITGMPDMRFKISNTLFKPGDALYDYMRNNISGAGLELAQIDTDSLVALNNYADDAINFFNEDTDQVEVLSNRYQVNGIVNPQQNVLANMQELANSSGVFVNYDITTGKWGVIIDRDTAPVHSFNDSNILGGIDVTATSLDGAYNAIEAEFPSRFIQDQTDTIRINLPVEFLNANEPENVLNVRFTMLNEPTQARELAYVALYQNRQDRVVTFTTDYSKISVKAGDVITLTNSIYGFNNQTLRVIRVKEVESEDGGILVEIVAQEYDSTLYTAGGQPRRPRTPSAPITLPSLGVIATPAAPLVTTANNNRQPSILLTGVVPTGVVDRFEFWYSTDNFATSFLIHEEKNANGAPFNSGTTILTRIATLPAGTYKFKVRAGNEKSYSNYSPASTELVWDPVQTTDAVTEDTSFSIGDLLPILGMGALAYFAYKALYPELLKALSNTDLGRLLGIEDPEQAAQIADQLEQESTAFRLVTAGGVLMTPEVDNSLTFIAGNGIDITVAPSTHDITIAVDGDVGGFNAIDIIDGDSIAAGSTDRKFILEGGKGVKITSNSTTGKITFENTCCDDDVPEELKPVDYGKPITKVLDNCQINYNWSNKLVTRTTAAVPAQPASWVTITGSGTYYDKCYRQNVQTLIINDPDKVLGIDIGKSKTFSGIQTPTITGQIDWSVSYLENKSITLKRVSETGYIGLKNWSSTNGSALPLTDDFCSTENPWSRPLFPSVDYPNGYELATYTNLQPVLAASGSALRFIYVTAKAAVPEFTTNKTYTGRTEIVRKPRVCVEQLEVNIGYGQALEFRGLLSQNILYTDNITLPVNSVITGDYVNATSSVPVGSGVYITRHLGGYTYEVNKEFPIDVTGGYTDMKYRKLLTSTISADEEPTKDYGLLTA